MKNKTYYYFTNQNHLYELMNLNTGIVQIGLKIDVKKNNCFNLFNVKYLKPLKSRLELGLKK
tara:strand:- start:150 stop:335 length:186 start_codon:yes stop_codon:yes gene_type:complete